MLAASPIRILSSFDPPSLRTTTAGIRMNQSRTTLRLTPVPSRTEFPARLVANPLVTPGAFDIARATQPATDRPRPASSRIDAETVIYRLEEAGQTLLTLPSRGPTTALRQTRHQYLAEAVEAFATEADAPPRLPAPSAARITRMDQALAWIPLIPEANLVLRRVVGCRSLVSPLTERHLFSWRRLARLLGADHKAIQRWHATGIDTIVATLNRDATLAAVWDTLG
jgi:hypothetical protein